MSLVPQLKLCPPVQSVDREPAGGGPGGPLLLDVSLCLVDSGMEACPTGWTNFNVNNRSERNFLAHRITRAPPILPL
jgi:hypothetical protein